MEKSRKIKILTVVALVIAIASMSLGFAAFSSVLNISSSATVNPNSSDFKVRIYGFETWEDLLPFAENIDEYGMVSEQYLSETQSFGLILYEDDGMSAEMSYIDNSTLSISNINVSFSKPSENAISYYYVIKNEGKYTAYFDLENFLSLNSDGYGSCQILGDDYSDETATACSYLIPSYSFLDHHFHKIENNSVAIESGDLVFMQLSWNYTGPYVDSPLLFEASNIKMAFTTKPQS